MFLFLQLSIDGHNSANSKIEKKHFVEFVQPEKILPTNEKTADYEMVWLLMEHQARVMTSVRSQLDPVDILKQPPAQVEEDEVVEVPLCAMALRRHLQCESSEFCCATRPCSPDH